MTSSWGVYYQRKMLLLMVLGFSSGLPLMLVFGTLSLWLTESGIDKAAIGLFALVKTPYTFKFLWSPFLDRYQPPVLGRLLGRRQSWAALSQILLICAILGMASTNPAVSPLVMAFMAVLVAFTSASQDIVLDAYRVEILEPKEQAAGSAIFVMGARIGLLTAGGGALYLAEAMPWQQVYAIMAVIQAVGLLAILFCAERQKTPLIRPQRAASTSWRQRTYIWLNETIFAPFKDFATRPKWWQFLLLVVTYKLGEAFLGVMANPFYIETGFTKTEIANVSKFYGTLATIIGGIIGGWLAVKVGLLKILIIGSVLQSLSNLFFVWLALHGANVQYLMITITADNISGGIGTTAFLALFANLCRKQYTATQFALLTSLMAFSRDVLAAQSGWVAALLPWPEFFVISTLLGLPGLFIVWWLRKPIQQAEHDAKETPTLKDSHEPALS